MALKKCSIMNSGVKQWIFQRISNALIVSFGFVLLCIFFMDKGLTYESLSQLLADSAFTYYLIVVLVFACVNSVLAAWQIDGDYAKKFGLPEKLITVATALVSVVYLVYGVALLF